jgi:hypothetical protein
MVNGQWLMIGKEPELGMVDGKWSMTSDITNFIGLFLSLINH